MEKEFSTLAEAREEIARLNKDLKAASALADETNLKLSASEASVKEFQEKLSSTESALAISKKSNEELSAKNAEQEKKISEFEAKEASASQKAQEILASVGQPPLSIKQNEASASESLLEKYEKLQGVEKTIFYREHKTEIQKILNKQRK